MAPEKRAPVLSTVAALVLSVVALIVALATGSGAILLDGAFNLCFFATALVTLRVARLLERPDDRQYPFGYLHFEPLINMVKGLLILGGSLIALIDAAFSLYRGGNEVSAGLALACGLRHPGTAPRSTRGGDPAGRRRHRQLSDQPRDLGRHPRPLLPAACPAASRPLDRAHRVQYRAGDEDRRGT